MWSKQRLVDLYQLVDQVVEALFVIRIGRSSHLILRRVAFKILSQHLLEILVQLFGALILRKMFLVVLDQLLNLLLELFI